MSLQAGTIYRYLRADADHDISGDVLGLSLDKGVTWVTAGIDYIATEDLPPGPAAIDAAKPPPAGLTGYWWRILTGPDDFALTLGQNVIRGELADNPETPHFAWTVNVTLYE